MNKETGLKLDHGKPRAGLVMSDFPLALMAIAKIGTFGAEKYAPRNWEKVENAIERYQDAMMRHLLFHWMGEIIDEDSGLPHLVCFAWNALALTELTLRDEKNAEAVKQ